MKKRILVENKKYAGKFVAMKSFANRTIISSGTNPREVLKRAKEKGVKNPVLQRGGRIDPHCDLDDVRLCHRPIMQGPGYR